jgi:transcription elongation GreA/GreB family factor
MEQISDKEKIINLEKKIADLRKIYANEIHESWTQGHQTEMMIDQYSEQLRRLKEQRENLQKDQNEFIEKTYRLHGEDKDREITLVRSNLDPASGRISADSPIGKILLTGKEGDKISIGENTFLIKKIQ